MSSEEQSSRRPWWLFISITRGFAAFFAVYSLLSLAAVALVSAYNQNVWWINSGFLPHLVSVLLQVLLMLALGLFALRVPRHIVSRVLLAIPVFVALFTTVINTIEVYATASSGAIILGFPLPFSLFVSVVLLLILLAILLGHTFLPTKNKPKDSATLLTIIITALCTIVLFPLGQIYCFGTTDYRVKVDAAVVFGAQVYPDGRPSPVLQDRLDTAIQFYMEGYTPLLVMSGGIDVDGTSEAEAMRDYAVAHGVAPGSIIIDEYGENTQQTARNTVEFLREAGFTKVATVSNFYHLARIKMLYLTQGMDVVTVPSQDKKSPTYPLFNVVREIPGWWYYWVQNLVK